MARLHLLYVMAANPVGGIIVAPKNIQAWNDEKEKWISFANIDGLTINGGGQIDGQGSVWWNACTDKALHFHNCNGLQLSKLRHLNSPKNHISISSSKGVYISNLHRFAPEKSPNTDGIDISRTSNVSVLNTVMETGDDCIAINGGSSYIKISGIACGPGHGISIGSLGKNGAYETLEEIHVRNCSFTGTQNAARIKTWQGGSGYARKISFERIRLINSEHPIIIDQNYDPNSLKPGSKLKRNKERAIIQMEQLIILCLNQYNSAVRVRDVTFHDVRGTSADEIAIDLVCSDSVGCNNVVLENIDIRSTIPEKQTYSRCNNAHGTAPSKPILLFHAYNRISSKVQTLYVNFHALKIRKGARTCFIKNKTSLFDSFYVHDFSRS
ncbi:putative polygalacturonase [Fagus crenata]